MKKTAILACLLAVLMCFASCGKKEQTQENPSETAGQTQESTDNNATQDENGSESEGTNEEVKTNEDGIPLDENGKTKVGVGGDKIMETAYGGTVSSIDGDKLTLTVDKTEEYEFALSEKAKKDIEHSSITVGTKVVIDFEVLEDGTKNALNINLDITKSDDE